MFPLLLTVTVEKHLMLQAFKNDNCLSDSWKELEKTVVGINGMYLASVVKISGTQLKQDSGLRLIWFSSPYKH